MCRCLPSGLRSSAHTRCKPRMSLKGPSRESVAAIIRNRESHRLGLAHCRRSSERLTAGLFNPQAALAVAPLAGVGPEAQRG